MGGVSYRYQEALIFMGGMELKNGIMVGYSYDWNVSDVGKYTGGSHEVTVAYHFGLQWGKRQKIYKSVRFLYHEVTKIVYFIGNEHMLIAHDSNRLRFS